MKIRYALSNSFGFGGTNGTLLMKQFEVVAGGQQSAKRP